MPDKKVEDKSKQIGVDILKAMYLEKLNLLENELDALDYDASEEFYLYLQDPLVKFNITIIGEVGGSKSTSAISIFNYLNSVLEKRFEKKIDRFSHIFSDQTEFLRYVNSRERNVCIVIDEFSRMAVTGLNATTEISLYDYYSDVFAQKDVHRIMCSPSLVMDKNCSVILSYIGKNEKEGLSKFKLSYRDPSENYRKVTLGTVTIPVKHILEKEFYIKYRKKKFDRMSLLDKHGVRDIRELEFADIILKVYDQLRDTCVDLNKTDISDIIWATIVRVTREDNRIYSMPTLAEIQGRTRNLLGLVSTRAKLYKKGLKTNGEERVMIEDKLKKFDEVLAKALMEEKVRREIYKEFLDI